MYKCELCHNISSIRERSNKLVTKKRPKEYTYRYLFGPRKGKIKFVSHGWEIVKEITVCSGCWQKETKK